MKPQLQLLVETIKQGIARRGFYILMDDRLSLIGGEQPVQLAVLSAFAKQHAWSAQIVDRAIVFWPCEN
jgi:hypothetical protein